MTTDNHTHEEIAPAAQWESQPAIVEKRRPESCLGLPQESRFVQSLLRPAGLAAWRKGLRPSCLPHGCCPPAFQPSSRARS